LRFSGVIEFKYNFPPVWKLRPLLTVRYGTPRAIPKAKTVAFENRIAGETRRQLKEQGLEGQYTKKDGDRVAIEIIFKCSTYAGDLDNYEKALIDGLNKADLFSDDNLVDLIFSRRVFVKKGKESILVRVARIESLEEGIFILK